MYFLFELALLTTLVVFALYSLHRLFLLQLWRSAKTSPSDQTASGEAFSGESFPFVTIQLPIYNEFYVVERLIESAANVKYPKDRFEIQILDDSDDETAKLSGDLGRTAETLSIS